MNEKSSVSRIMDWIVGHMFLSIAVFMLMFFALAMWSQSCERAKNRYLVTSELGQWTAWRVSESGGCARLFLVDGPNMNICGTFKVERLPDAE